MLHFFTDLFDCTYLIVSRENSAIVLRGRSFLRPPQLWDFFCSVCSEVKFPTELVLPAAATDIPPREAHVLAKDCCVLCERWVCAAGAVGGHGDLWA